MSVTPTDLTRSSEWRFAQKNAGGYSADLAGDCENPVTRLMRGAADPVKVKLGLETERHIVVDIDVRCRKCAACKRARRRYWSLRAMNEVKGSNRTWFGTLTLAPEYQFRCEALARHRLARSGVRYDDLSPDEAFKERVRPLIEELQRYLKRLRKSHPGLRHLVVVERHKSGDPHLHLMVHETAGPIRHKQLTAKWAWGFSKFNLVAEGENSKAVGYVTKYLTKALNHRVIASKEYGKTPL